VTASSRRAYFGPEHSWVETAVIPREALNAEPRPGPFIVEEYDATTVVPPGAAARRDDWGNILISVEGPEE
jgi:N-methylhydantoinase A